MGERIKCQELSKWSGTLALVLRQTGSVLGAQPQNEGVVRWFDGRDGKLRDERGFVLHIHIEVVGLQHWAGFVENAEQFASGQAVVGVVGQPSLQTTGAVVAHSAAAVDEVFIHARDFGDVSMGRDMAAGRQEEADVFVGVARELGLEFVKLHRDVRGESRVFSRAGWIWSLRDSMCFQSHGSTRRLCVPQGGGQAVWRHVEAGHSRAVQAQKT